MHEDIINKQFGSLTVLKQVESIISPGGISLECYECLCSCGNKVVVNLNHLTTGHIRSCGCVKNKVRVREDLTGKQFGYWKVLYQADDYISLQGIHLAQWHCKCKCGNERDVSGNELKKGNSKSCGCYKADSPLVGQSQITHGESKTRLYNIWHSIKLRCLNPKDKAYNNYGGRGITICDEWKDSFENFRDWAIHNGYKDDLTIDRIDNDKNYCPDNCRWTTYKEQNRNRRSNKLFTVNGVTKTLAEWSEECGFSASMITRRLTVNHLSFEQAITIPKQISRKKGLMVK